MMTKITTCEAFPEGNLIPWSIENWELSDEGKSAEFGKWVDVDSTLFCPKPSRYMYFPGWNAVTFETMEQFCQMFGGQVVNTTTKEQLNDAFEFMKDIWLNPYYPKNVDHVGTFLTLWNDNAEEGNWVHVDPKHPPPDIVWHFQEPNGENGENCLQYQIVLTNAYTENETVSSLVAKDYSCEGEKPALCENTRKFIGKLYGLCEYTMFDTTYLMPQNPDQSIGKFIRRFFFGNFGWKMAWDHPSRVWRLGSQVTNETYAKIECLTNETTSL